MTLPYNAGLRPRAKGLRNHMTDAERRLWSAIRGRQGKGCQFYRQKIIGNSIVDFYCARAKLVVEVDGGQHYEDGPARKDRARDRYMRGLGLEVLRLSDTDVLGNLGGVVDRIEEAL